jgi:hypothetical protein
MPPIGHDAAVTDDGMIDGAPIPRLRTERLTCHQSPAEWLILNGANVTAPGSTQVQTPAMDKTTLLRDMRETHARIHAAVAALDDDALLAEAPGMPGWTRKEVLAHLEWWSDHSARVVSALAKGEEPYDRSVPFDLDAHNARIRDEARSRPADDIRRGEAEAFERVLAAVEAASEDALLDAGRYAWLDDEPLVETVAWDTVRHYPEHLPHLAR